VSWTFIYWSFRTCDAQISNKTFGWQKWAKIYKRYALTINSIYLVVEGFYMEKISRLDIFLSNLQIQKLAHVWWTAGLAGLIQKRLGIANSINVSNLWP